MSNLSRLGLSVLNLHILAISLLLRLQILFLSESMESVYSVKLVVCNPIPAVYSTLATGYTTTCVSEASTLPFDTAVTMNMESNHMSSVNSSLSCCCFWFCDIMQEHAANVPLRFSSPSYTPSMLAKRALLLLLRSFHRRHDFHVLWVHLYDPPKESSLRPMTVASTGRLSEILLEALSRQSCDVVGGGREQDALVDINNPKLPDDINWHSFNLPNIESYLKDNHVTYSQIKSISCSLQLQIIRNARNRADLVAAIALTYADSLCSLLSSHSRLVDVYNELADRGFGCFHSAVWPELLNIDPDYHDLNTVLCRLPPQLLNCVCQRFNYSGGVHGKAKFVSSMYKTEYLQTRRERMDSAETDRYLTLLFDDLHVIAKSTTTQNLGQSALTDKINDVQTKWLKRVLRNPIASHLTEDVNSSWPQPVTDKIKQACADRYISSSDIKVPESCASCSRARIGAEMRHVNFTRTGCAMLDLGVLAVPHDASFAVRQAFRDEHPVLDGIFLDKSAIVEGRRGQRTLSMCTECYQALTDGKIPKYSLRNGLFRGTLPEQFSDLTWVEEMVCAIYRTTAHVTRLYQSDDPRNPYKLHGNTCAHETNVVSTADVLPRTPSDILDQLSIVFVGPNKPTESQMRNIFRVRKSVIVKFLSWLKDNNPLYANIQISDIHASHYNDDNTPLPGLMDRIIHDQETDPRKAFEEEAASLDKHPAQMFMDFNSDLNSPSAEDSDNVFLSTSGVVDPEGSKISGRSTTSSALMNLALGNKRPLNEDGQKQPDLKIWRGADAIAEYHNPSLFPGMFPTLFPFGLAGFELDRDTKISFQKQAEYFLDLADHCFRHHKYFIFVACNILQRRQSHLHTHLTVKRRHFQETAEKLSQYSDDLVASVATHLQQERPIKDLNEKQKEVMDVLNKLNTVAAKVSGSQASKILERNTVRSYTGHFGIPQLYLTMNPDPANSPIFQVLYGDKTVDLSKQFPELVNSGERAKRLAADPVAAADFFDMSIKLFLDSLGGWDFKKGASKKDGGIFGHIQAFYGTAEYTERGKLHGHFLIWLAGGLNPSETHKRMTDDLEFKGRFFQFFDDLIHHHLPDIETEIDPNYQPKVERPQHDFRINMDNAHMQEQVKKCGEALQRHQCRSVCHKYGHDQDCRFDFPHEVVQESSFDRDSNSIRLRCLDSTVNFFNPIILTLFRHNHDLKCILSGRSAKAAIFYITDYITKSEMNTHQALSLLSRVIARNPVNQSEIHSPVERSKTLLRKWLSQFCSQQSIHAQQAVRYLRGYGDSIKSHDTVPMLSSLAVHYARTLATRPDIGGASSVEGNAACDVDEEHAEDLYLTLQRSSDGSLCDASQVDDYIHRDRALSFMCFYDFVRCIRKENMSERSGKETLPRFKLRAPHTQCGTHELIMFMDPSDRQHWKEKVPRVIGMSIPREGSESHALFMLAHFYPWSASQPLCAPVDMKPFLLRRRFAPRILQIMQNWEDLFECQDERDAERIRRRQASAQKADILTKACFNLNNDDPILSLDDLETSDDFRTAEECRETASLSTSLQSAQWFASPESRPEDDTTDVEANGPVHDDCITTNPVWKNEIKAQEMFIAQRRRGEIADQTQITVGDMVACTESGQKESSTSSGGEKRDLECNAATVKRTESSIKLGEETRGLDIIEEYATQFGLNKKQRIQFEIVAVQFLKTLEARRHLPANEVHKHLKPLRALMTGPGGTGKSYVIQALQALMTRFECAHEIRYLAPTGCAATLISGLTIHSGLSIQIVDNKNGRSNRCAGEDGERYTVSIKKKEEVHREWKNVTFVLIDEVSLLGSQLLAELDQALRFAKECDEWFGGINVMFSGDLYQYPPVLQTPLYTPLAVDYKEKPDMIKRSIGRMAWKTIDTVVDFTEQKRMAGDPEYAEAVSRLRKRECTLEDVDLFNSRVLKSDLCPNGILLQHQPEAQRGGAVIVKTNRARVDINNQKVIGQTSGNSKCHLVISTAQHLVGKHAVDANSQKSLLKFTGVTGGSKDILPSFIPLYKGMPIILRGRNISTDLGIANGSQGTIRRIITDVDINGMSKVDCVVAEFAGSPVKLAGLPRGWFPLYPDTCVLPGRFAGINGNPAGQQATRRQLPFQPGFATTGQSAQGKTLEPVFVDLSLGGFHAYVAASRARCRQGLFLTRPVTLQDLNKPPPSDLAFEAARLDALAHNTLVRYDFLDEAEVPVPDRESEREIISAFRMPLIATDQAVHSKSSNVPRLSTRKRAASVADDLGSRKKAKLDEPCALPPAPRKDIVAGIQRPSFHRHPTAAGPRWDSNNYSCAYDAVFMHVHASLLFDHSDWGSLFNASNIHAHTLSKILLSTTTSHSQGEILSLKRDAWRDYLSSHNPTSLPRRGAVFASVENVLKMLNSSGDSDHTFSTQCTCAIGRVYCNPGTWANHASRHGLNRNASSASLQTWLKLYGDFPHAVHGEHCGLSSRDNPHTYPFPSLAFLVPSHSFPRVLPTLQVTHLGAHYHLRTIIYHGSSHFAVRTLDDSLTFWTHDGMREQATLHNPQRVTNDSMSWLATLGDDKKAHVYIFNRTGLDPSYPKK